MKRFNSACDLHFPGSKFFLGGRSCFTTVQVMQEMTTQRQQKDDNIRKMVEKAQLPDLIRRDKTFSAIGNCSFE
jgi:hypothetical protein